MKATPEDCFHLNVPLVREIHDEALSKFGGLSGIRDENLLASAIMAPQASFGGRSPFTDLVDVAAAYLYYLCRNHPFLDGNKRTAMMAAIVFLRLNGIETAPDGPRWEKLILDVAAGRIDRDMTTRRLRSLLRKLRKA